MNMNVRVHFWVKAGILPHFPKQPGTAKSKQGGLPHFTKRKGGTAFSSIPLFPKLGPRGTAFSNFPFKKCKILHYEWLTAYATLYPMAERVSGLPVSYLYGTCYSGRSVLIVVRSRLRTGTGQTHTQTDTQTHRHLQINIVGFYSTVQ